MDFVCGLRRARFLEFFWDFGFRAFCLRQCKSSLKGLQKDFGFKFCTGEDAGLL